MNPPQSRLVLRALAAVVLVAGLHAASATAAPDPPRSPLPAVEAHPAVIAAPVSWSALQEGIDARAAWYAWAASIPVPDPDPEPPPPVPARPRPARLSGSTHHGYATARECVSEDENGGDYGPSRNPTHCGRYQFSRPAWISFGGIASHWDDWSLASPAEQDTVFDTAWSQGPAVQEQQWLRWDGC